VVEVKWDEPLFSRALRFLRCSLSGGANGLLVTIARTYIAADMAGYGAGSTACPRAGDDEDRFRLFRCRQARDGSVQRDPTNDDSLCAYGKRVLARRFLCFRVAASRDWRSTSRARRFRRPCPPSSHSLLGHHRCRMMDATKESSSRHYRFELLRRGRGFDAGASRGARIRSFRALRHFTPVGAEPALLDGVRNPFVIASLLHLCSAGWTCARVSTQKDGE